MTDDDQIREGDTITHFLADPVVQRTMDALAASYMQEWKSGKSKEDRESAWAKTRALDDLKEGFRAVVDAGRRAAINVQRRESGKPRR